MNKVNATVVSFILSGAVLMSLAPSPTTAQGRGGGQRGGRGGAAAAAPTPIRRMPDGKPDLTGFFGAQAGGANYGLEQHPRDGLTPQTSGVVVDPPDGKLPYQPWARAESIERELPHRGYDDPTAHCFVAGLPRSHYTPSPYQILQPPGYVIVLFERMSWRQIPIDGRQHLPDNVRLWQGDSIGHWEGDTLVVDTKNLNGKAWLNERGDVLTHQAHIVERFTPVDGNTITYEARVTDPGAYSAPWTIRMPLNRQTGEYAEILEIACHEDNGDLQHLKDVRDEYRKAQNK